MGMGPPCARVTLAAGRSWFAPLDRILSQVLGRAGAGVCLHHYSHAGGTAVPSPLSPSPAGKKDI